MSQLIDNETKEEDVISDVNTTNMASQVNANHSAFLMERFRPKRYKKNQEIEEFIKECERYFKLTKVSKEMKEAIVIGCLDDEAIIIYEKVKEETKDYAERLRIAFKKRSSVLEDMSRALSFTKTDESTEDYFEKVEKLVDQLLQHKWEKEELMRTLLVHCNKNEEIKREIKMRELSSSVEIKSVIKKLDELKEEERGFQVNAVRTYKDALRNNPRAIQAEGAKRETAVKPIVQSQCYNCNGYGHWARDCEQKSRRQCRGCKEEGHIQRECPNIQCNRCNLRGHHTAECYTNLQRRQRNGNAGQEYPRRTGYFQLERGYQQDRGYQSERGYPQQRGYQQGQRYQQHRQEDKEKWRQNIQDGKYNQNINGNTKYERKNYNNRIAAVQMETERDENQINDQDPNDEAPISEERIGAMY